MSRAVACGLALLASLCLLPATARAREAPPPPAVSAPSAILLEPSTGEVLYARAADARRPIASATKLMTALLTVDRVALSEVVPAADYDALPVESQLGLRAGERLTVRDLLRGLMLESANDAAVTLAEAVSGSRAAFVRAMNRRARRLGLTNTHFANPIGLDAARNFSSARDLARLAVRVRRHRFLRRLADRSRVVLESGDRSRTVRNRNTLVVSGPAWVNGLKTGHTLGAGYVLVGTGTRRGASMVSVVLGTSSEAARNGDTLGLLTWGLRQFRRRSLVRDGDFAGNVPIRYRRGAALPLAAGTTLRRTVRTDATIRTRDVGVPAEVEGPIERGTRIGWREVLVDGRRVARVPIEAAASVPAAGLTQKAKDWFTQPLVVLLAAAVATGTVLVVRRLRRGPVRRRATRSEPEAA
ncbi:MAG TPA: D-alanyl-D-alanine carboxypeptidase family protein [Solirubrobacteraceae bacterium]|nr:D-alanyl-D-alanine carboxypeptidase family protein [Solirubrobacteraceae bacterium]